MQALLSRVERRPDCALLPGARLGLFRGTHFSREFLLHGWRSREGLCLSLADFETLRKIYANAEEVASLGKRVFHSHQKPLSRRSRSGIARDALGRRFRFDCAEGAFRFAPRGLAGPATLFAGPPPRGGPFGPRPDEEESVRIVSEGEACGTGKAAGPAREEGPRGRAPASTPELLEEIRRLEKELQRAKNQLRQREAPPRARRAKAKPPGAWSQKIFFIQNERKQVVRYARAGRGEAGAAQLDLECSDPRCAGRAALNREGGVVTVSVRRECSVPFRAHCFNSRAFYARRAQQFSLSAAEVRHKAIQRIFFEEVFRSVHSAAPWAAPALFEMLFGAKPKFSGAELEALFQRVLSREPFPPRGGALPVFRRVIGNCVDALRRP